MATQLEIQDGNPYWYLSPDIWVTQTVGGNTTIITQPDVGGSYNVVAKVRVTVLGSGSPPQGAVVKFYWADPSTTPTPSTATLIGQQTVDLALGDNEVVSPTWVPSWVNDGHECLIALVEHQDDPIVPAIGPTSAFDPPNHRQVAQLNIHVAESMGGGLMMMYFGAGRPKDPEDRGPRKFSVVARRVAIEGAADLFERTRQRLPKEMPGRIALGVQAAGPGRKVKGLGRASVTLSGRKATLQRMVLAVKAPGRAARGTAALLVVEQIENKRVVGGVAVLLRAGKGAKGRAVKPRKRK